jgi:hypothetical protein
LIDSTLKKIIVFLCLIQNEYDDLLRRAVVVTHNGLTTQVTMNQSALGLRTRTVNKKSSIIKINVLNIQSLLILADHATDLIDLSSPDTHRTDISQSEIGKR